MTRRFTEPHLLIASANPGKIKEIAELLQDCPATLHSTAEFKVKEPEETGSTFRENALLKAEYYSKKTKLPALADDSGLSVDALDGAPGIYSARWGGPDKDFGKAMERVEQELKNRHATDNRARFICALA